MLFKNLRIGDDSQTPEGTSKSHTCHGPGSEIPYPEDIRELSTNLDTDTHTLHIYHCICDEHPTR